MVLDKCLASFHFPYCAGLRETGMAHPVQDGGDQVACSVIKINSPGKLK